MAGLAHLGIGFAAKRMAPKIPVGFLLLAAAVIDLLWTIFFFTGIERGGSVPWSHGLFMSAVWSITAALSAGFISGSRRTGIVIGLVVFSHWVMDFISHPMYLTKDLRPDLPLFFDGSPMLGLGLYKSMTAALIKDFGIFILGLAVYIAYIIKNRRESQKQL